MVSSDADTKMQIGIAVWGIGDHSLRTILPAISQIPELHLVSIGSRSKVKVEIEAAKLGCTAVGSLMELLQLDDIDVIFVATPIGCHADDVDLALEAGKHVWCEKAFTQNLDQAIRLVDKSRDKDLAVCVSCPPLYHYVYRHLVSLLEDSVIGRVQVIDAHFGFPHVLGHSKYDPNIGGGALLDVGFYPLIVGSSLLDETATVKAAILEIDSGFDVDTAGTSLIRMTSGAHLISRWGYGRDYINEIQIFGETGSLRVTPAFSKPSNLPLKMTIQRQNKIKEVPIQTTNQFTEMLQSFTQAIEDKTLRESYRNKAIEQQQLVQSVHKLAQSK